MTPAITDPIDLLIALCWLLFGIPALIAVVLHWVRR